MSIKNFKEYSKVEESFTDGAHFANYLTNVIKLEEALHKFGDTIDNIQGERDEEAQRIAKLTQNILKDELKGDISDLAHAISTLRGELEQYNF